MAEELEGNCMVAQSGGPTAVINASVAGVVAEALNNPCIEEIFGGLNGVLGILKEDIIDLAEESQQNIRGLRYTPGSALGACRFKLKRDEDYQRVIDVFEAHNVRYFFYVGGNDSQDTADKISTLAKEKDYALRVIGIPKTIDNDLVTTDHCPGYGSVVKYVSSVVREIALDHGAMGQHDLVSIVEVMGRNAGWIAAGTTLAKRRENPNDAPHLLYLPELPFSRQKFIEDVQGVLKKNRYCLVVVGEGLQDKDGNYLANTGSGQDAFGHVQLGGVGDYLANFVEENLAVNARSSKLGTGQRAAAHCSSQTDNDEAFMVGQTAVRVAIEGESDKMVILVRDEGEPYKCDTGLAPLSEIANGVKEIPEDWISEDRVSMSAKFIKYAQPLIQGEVEVPYDNGLPSYVRLSKRRIRRVLDPHNFE
ncbi:MAG: 6-phosphofructokinase [Opitutales bacterium]